MSFNYLALSTEKIKTKFCDMISAAMCIAINGINIKKKSTISRNVHSLVIGNRDASP